MDYDLEWTMVDMDSNLQWRVGFVPFRKLKGPTIVGVGMGERCRRYNGAPPEVGDRREVVSEEFWMGDDFGWCGVTKA